MAYSKYADLPGIAHDEPDVYETTDLPESDQTTDFYEEESESVEKIGISPADAFNRYKGRSLSSNKIDFSDRINKGICVGYDYELVGEGRKETILQRYQRLQCEMAELLEDVVKIKTSKDAVDDCLVSSEQVQQSLNKLMGLRLEETLGADVVSSITDPQGSQIKKLVSQLEKFKGSTSSEQKVDVQAGDTNNIIFQLNYRPELAYFKKTNRLADLECRLQRLENVLGGTSERLSRLSNIVPKGSLLEVAQYLSATASMLDSAQLDHIEGRLTALSQKMDSLSEKERQTSYSSEDQQKILELYELVKNNENIMKLLPDTIERLRALEALHVKAAAFTKTITQVESLQSNITSGVETNRTLLQGIQESFVNNLNEINKTVISLDSRIKQLKKQ